MTGSLSSEELPEPLARLIGPWREAVAEPERAQTPWLRELAEIRPRKLRGWIVSSAVIEGALTEARRATLALAGELECTADPSLAVSAQAQSALARLESALRDAKPSAGKVALGLGW